MNKMNLPAPFRPALPTPPLPPPVPAPVAEKRQAGELSSGESELESSDEVSENLSDPLPFVLESLFTNMSRHL
jgi:U11/U12 small nuclear ribonucleoprotein SNRNP65